LPPVGWLQVPLVNCSIVAHPLLATCTKDAGQLRSKGTCSISWSIDEQITLLTSASTRRTAASVKISACAVSWERQQLTNDAAASLSPQTARPVASAPARPQSGPLLPPSPPTHLPHHLPCSPATVPPAPAHRLARAGRAASTSAATETHDHLMRLIAKQPHW
jgi:hypothetical protein